MEADEAPHSVDVGVFSADRIVANADGLAQAVEQWLDRNLRPLLSATLRFH